MINYKIKYTTLTLPFSLVFIAILMFVVQDTDNDRYMYIRHFTNPFENSRIEIGFQYYMHVFKLLELSPVLSTIITSLITYTLLSVIFFKQVKLYWLESLMIINFIIIAIFNYYLGTSIRMGLALSIALYSFYKIQENNKLFYFILLITPLFHYGISLFVLVVLFVKIFRLNNWNINKKIIFILIISSYAIYSIMIDVLSINSYYSMYIDGYGKTNRVFSFGMILYIFILSLMTLLKYKSFEYQVSMYGIPFLIISILFNIVVIQKMLVVFLFIGLVEFFKKSYLKIFKVEYYIRFIILFTLNILGLIYALIMYNYI